MKKIIATTGMLAYILYFNSTGALASAMPDISATDDVQTTKHHQSFKQAKHKPDHAVRLAQKLGVDTTQLQLDRAAGLSPKGIMKKYNITKNQFRELSKKSV